jgi:hypothetical protein
VIVQFFLTVSGLAVSAGNFVKYPFTSLVNRYSFDMFYLVNVWVKWLWPTVLEFPFCILNMIFTRE